MMTILKNLLLLYFWVGVVTLILLINRIARFYQLTTGVRSYYRAFLVPAFLFLAGTVRYLFSDQKIAGDILGDMLFFLGGISLSLVGYFLLRLMTGGR
jgi:hypothetical protein